MGIFANMTNGVTYGINILIFFGYMAACLTAVPVAYKYGKYKGKKAAQNAKP